MRALQHGMLPAEPCVFRIGKDPFGQLAVHAGTHLTGGVTRKGHDDRFLRRKIRFGEQRRDALGQDRGLAAARCRTDHDRRAPRLDRGLLFSCPCHRAVPPLRS